MRNVQSQIVSQHGLVNRAPIVRTSQVRKSKQGQYDAVSRVAATRVLVGLPAASRAELQDLRR